MNQVVLTGYLAREVEVEQHRGGHLVGRTLLVVPRGRQGRGPAADLVPIVVHGRAEVLAVAELDPGVRVWVTCRLSATYREACEGRYVVAAREMAPVGGWPSDPALAAGGRRGRGEVAAQAAESSHLVTRAGRRPKRAMIHGAVAVGDPDGAQRSPSARRPYLTVLPGRLDVEVRDPGPVIDRDDGDRAGASGRVSPRRRCP
jgi:single-stranded DNA-binding protein